jgi:hypothetical protein
MALLACAEYENIESSVKILLDFWKEFLSVGPMPLLQLLLVIYRVSAPFLGQLQNHQLNGAPQTTRGEKNSHPCVYLRAAALASAPIHCV